MNTYKGRNDDVSGKNEPFVLTSFEKMSPNVFFKLEDIMLNVSDRGTGKLNYKTDFAV